MTLEETIQTIARAVTDELLTRHEYAEPRDLNDGCCDLWARAFFGQLQHLPITAEIIWLDDLLDGPQFPNAHCVVNVGGSSDGDNVVGGLWYDSEVDGVGVASWRDLPFCKRLIAHEARWKVEAPT